MLDTGCCGTNLRNDRISFWGYFTLAFPALIVLSVMYPLSFLIGSERRGKWKTIVVSLYEMSKRIILVPKLKLFISTKIYLISPVLSGFTFKLFNLFWMMSMWFLLAWIVLTIQRLI
ncbi:MAG: hypothetical protein CME60_04020 [Halobacteriovoraceae bacterium]|nr:hypothetical protein [Halobacteriovoraceae bacterium]